MKELKFTNMIEDYNFNREEISKIMSTNMNFQYIDNVYTKAVNVITWFHVVDNFDYLNKHKEARYILKVINEIFKENKMYNLKNLYSKKYDELIELELKRIYSDEDGKLNNLIKAAKQFNLDKEAYINQVASLNVSETIESHEKKIKNDCMEKTLESIKIYFQKLEKNNKNFADYIYAYAYYASCQNYGTDALYLIEEGTLSINQIALLVYNGIIKVETDDKKNDKTYEIIVDALIKEDNYEGLLLLLYKIKKL